ncbi:protein-glutamate O-methyltransferase CheR [Moritella sp.]|uniref:CheR family methyltransferase n=1 Tax=Moritella sp. TaxID=78556 RepID=UPI001D3FE3BC|nr:protein-glutamate O-methyltransferase CheR [Moritella sp.]MCJ8348328.1 protein-glutamate O-methyltransferase CheR [Moritella sp.]NQZ38848.1 protein-glutamate O-methyltransferase CheR [Moritella sp.]
MQTLSNEVYTRFSEFLEIQCGIVLGQNKQYLVKSRLLPLLAKHNMASLTELVQKSMTMLARDLRNDVIDAMTTNETLWFRDVYPFEYLQAKLLPEFINKGLPVKIWSAASSSGQEPFSIAMSAIETQEKLKRLVKPNVQIVGTDISPTMIKHCKAGIYDRLALGRGLSAERKRQFFTILPDDKMQVNRDVQQLTSFREINLLESYALLGKFDIIFCRNVLIYFSPKIKSQILNQFAGALKPGGYLFLGASESLTGLTDKFEMIRCNPGIVYRLK